MKKIYLLALTSVFGVTLVSAQTKQSGKVMPITKTQKNITVNALNSNRAEGDTVFYFPFPGVYLANSDDQAAFAFATEDVDGLTTNNAGAPIDFALYYSVNVDTNAAGQPTGDNYYHPWENPAAGDSAYFISATSWFNPAGKANNWAMFGPVTIPAAGAMLSWYEKFNPFGRDGYKVWVASSISGTEPSSIDFENGGPIGQVIYTSIDVAPSPTAITDSTWQMRSAAVWGVTPGTQVWFGFQHTANDIDAIYLDEFLVTEATNAGINNVVENITISQNSPNPFNNQTTIQYNLKANSNVNLTITDITGRVVKVLNTANVGAGTHNITLNANEFAAGAYNYTLTANGNSVTKKMFVTK